MDSKHLCIHRETNKLGSFLVCFSVQYISPPKHTHTHFCYIYFFYVSNLLSLDTGLYIWNYETDHRNEMKQMTKTVVTTQWETIRWGGWNIWRSETLSRGEGEQNFYTKGGSDSRMKNNKTFCHKENQNASLLFKKKMSAFYFNI